MKKTISGKQRKPMLNHLHNQDLDSPVAHEVVPQLNPHWTYQPGDPGIRRLNYMITCLLGGIQKNTHIHVSYDKVREVTQGADENPALFLSCLTGAVQKYTNLDITTPAGLPYLHLQFITQSAPDVRHKLRQLEKCPETPCPQRDLLEVAFTVFSNRRRLREKDVREKLNMPFWRQQLREEISPAQVIPEQGLRPAPSLDPASDATSQNTGQRHAQTRGPHKSMPKLWSMGTLENGLSPGTPWHS